MGRSFWQSGWLTVDLRTLALFRVAFAVVLAADLWAWARQAPPGWPVRFAVAAGAVACLLLAAGLFTWVMQGVVLVGFNLLHWDAPVLSGHLLPVELLCVWTAFLPLGERASGDALRRVLGEASGAGADAPRARAARQAEPPEHVSFAYLGLCASLAALPLLQPAHAASGLAPRLVEVAILTAVLLPRWEGWPRRIAIALLVSWYGSALVAGGNGVTSAAMFGFALLLVSPEDWDAVLASQRRLAARRLVRYEPRRPLEARAAYVLARLDALEQLDFVESEEGLEVSHHGEPGVRGPAALAELAQALPFGRAWAWVVRLPGVRGVAYRLAVRLLTAQATG